MRRQPDLAALKQELQRLRQVLPWHACIEGLQHELSHEGQEAAAAAPGRGTCFSALHHYPPALHAEAAHALHAEAAHASNNMYHHTM